MPRVRAVGSTCGRRYELDGMGVLLMALGAERAVARLHALTDIAKCTAGITGFDDVLEP